jgi:preprotein translocase subunit SecA
LHAVRQAVRSWRDRTDGDLRHAATVARGGPPQAGADVLWIFPLVCEAARRTLGLEPFDEQIVAALALADGAIVEVQTGEGKTLAATMPVAWWACAGRGVHVLTFNDYLARRDAEWMGPVYRVLGLSAVSISQGLDASARRAAYAADITYVTAKEAGFDHLRDLCAPSLAARVHRPFHAAVVDEADSVLIDDGRFPLVLAGALEEEPTFHGAALAAVVGSLEPALHFEVDESGRNVELTDAGLECVERTLGHPGMHETADQALLGRVNCALHARALLRAGTHYLVRDGRIELIDELTGRTAPDRQWPEGLQAAVEAKEGLVVRPEGQVLSSMTLQTFLRSYPHLAGMTGTAREAAAELFDIYGRPVVVVPPHRPSRRVDHADVVFTHRQAKEAGVVAEVRRAHESGRPVLVGTLTVEESERLAVAVREAGVPCSVLNAVHDEDEAAVVARAGAFAAVTIATNMAGRGTDIRLGGEQASDRARVEAAGGLFVIGTGRHESVRIDRQLRGRAGRQGDPGETRFFVSLEDDLLVRHGGLARLVPASLLPPPQDAPLESPLVAREIARAQRIIDGQHRDIRRTLSAYARVVEQQYEAVLQLRHAWLQDQADQAAVLALDRLWRQHLEVCAQYRETAHLARLGGRQPLDSYTSAVREAFAGFEDALTRELAFPRVRDAAATGLPSSTWSYLVNDDPFAHTMGTMLSGPGGQTVAIYAAALLGPLLLAWGAVDRWLRPSARKPTCGR